MGLIAAIKSLLGVGSSESGQGTDVTVEREPDPSTERAVKTTSPADTVAEGDSSQEPTAPGSDSGDASGETEVDERGEPSGESVREIKGIGATYAERLAEAGVRSVDDLADATAAELAEEADIGESRVETWIERARAR